jgi:hypothetical protein
MGATAGWVRGVAVEGRRVDEQRQLPILVHGGIFARAAVVPHGDVGAGKPCPKRGNRDTTNRRGLWLQSTPSKTVASEQKLVAVSS